jgi:hypothetical protein
MRRVRWVAVLAAAAVLGASAGCSRVQLHTITWRVQMDQGTKGWAGKVSVEYWSNTNPTHQVTIMGAPNAGAIPLEGQTQQWLSVTLAGPQPDGVYPKCTLTYKDHTDRKPDPKTPIVMEMPRTQTCAIPITY